MIIIVENSCEREEQRFAWHDKKYWVSPSGYCCVYHRLPFAAVWAACCGGPRWLWSSIVALLLSLLLLLLLLLSTSDRSFYPRTSSVHPVSVLILHPRETPIMWSRTVVADCEKKKKKKKKNARKNQGKQIKSQRTRVREHSRHVNIM